MVELIKISKSYQNKRVLDDISFNIPGNSVTGVIGPNGAGKSTLMRIIAGFEFPDSGSVIIFNERVENFNQRKKFLSYMPETVTLYPQYFVSRFLDFYHRASGIKDDQLLSTLSLKKVYNKRIGYLSKGWHQRLKLYTSLCNEKPIVILDEPFDGFDPLQLNEIIKLLDSQRATGRSFILSIHQLSDAQKICDYFILLDNGKLLSGGSLDDLGTRFSSDSSSLEDIFLKALS